MINALQRDVLEGVEALTERLEPLGASDPGEQLLPDRAEQDHAVFMKQRAQARDDLLLHRVERAAGAPQRERPHRGVHDDPHGVFRWRSAL
jgi:hypothetical protein